jgi:tetrahydromethanopterin S-methyltransferase subunit G
METENKSNIEHALKWGLILGMANIFIYLIAYIIDKSILTQWWMGLASLAINITLMIIPVTSKRKELGGFITFKDAFLICFIVIAGGALLQSVFNYVLYNLIDPGLSEYVKEKAIESATSMMEKFGAPQEEMEKAIEKLQNEDFSQTPARIGKQYAFGLLFGAVLALIVAAIFKKQPKAEFE